MGYLGTSEPAQEAIPPPAEEPSVVAVDSAQEQDGWELVASSPRELGTSD